MTLENSFDGEKQRDILMKLEDPQHLSLGQLVNEIVSYAQILPLINLSSGKPDYIVFEEAINNRLKKLYGELDRREKCYQNKKEE